MIMRTQKHVTGASALMWNARWHGWRRKPFPIHCWQGDDVAGFDQKDGKAGDGIQTTGNYPGQSP